MAKQSSYRLSSAIVGCVALSLASATWAATVVDFNAATVGVPDSYVDVSRTPAVFTPSEARFDLDTTAPLFNAYPALVGGLHIANSASGGTFNTWRLHDNDPAGWPNTPKLFLACSDESGGVSYNNVNVVYLFDKAGFVGGAAGSSVSFDATSSLSLNVTEWDSYWNGGRAGEMRFLVRNAGQYYVSEAVLSGAGSLTLAGFNNNAAAGKGWAPITLTATSFDLPTTGLSYGPMNFTDVTGIGWIGAGSAAYFRTFGFDTFSASAVVPEPASLSLLALGGLMLRRRR